MSDQCGQKFSGLHQVVAELAAAERMTIVVNSVNRTLDEILILLDELLCDSVDTAYDRDDPELITNGSAAILSQIAHESLRSNFRKIIDFVIVIILAALRETGLDIVCVYPFADFDVAGRNGDFIAVLDDRGTFLDFLQSDLMTASNVFYSSDGKTFNCDKLAFYDIFKNDGDVVGGMNFNSFHSVPFKKYLFKCRQKFCFNNRLYISAADGN